MQSWGMANDNVITPDISGRRPKAWRPAGLEGGAVMSDNIEQLQDLHEIPHVISNSIDSWCRIMAATKPEGIHNNFRRATLELKNAAAAYAAKYPESANVAQIAVSTSLREM